MSVAARHSNIQQVYAAAGHTAIHSLTRDTVKVKMPLKECAPIWISNANLDHRHAKFYIKKSVPTSRPMCECSPT
jgi:hypothetical protein